MMGRKLPQIFLLEFLLLPLSLSTSSAQEHQQDPFSGLPLIVSTWATKDFQSAAQKAFDTLISTQPNVSKGSPYRRLYALVEGLSECEKCQCDRTVGFGGSPDENGETTLDALVMDGPSHRSGAVAALRRVKAAARVAWSVMNYTEHSLLVGEKATQFALAMGFPEETLETAESEQMHSQWHKNLCQPNYWKNVQPNPKTGCGPYTPDDSMKPPPMPSSSFSSPRRTFFNALGLGMSSGLATSWLSLGPWSMFGRHNHDTIGMLLIDEQRNVVAGTSSNGARNKIPGRVGDSPIVGAGAYADNEVGGAAATGDGDLMMRFLPSFLAVELMRHGQSPAEATREAIGRIQRYQPKFFGAIIAASVDGAFGAACSKGPNGELKIFGYSVVDPRTGGGKVRVEEVECL